MITPFKHEKDAKVFMNDGVVTFPLLSNEDVNFVLDIYHKANGAEKRLEQSQFYGVNYSLGTLTNDENYSLMKPVLNLLKEKLHEKFVDYEILGCVFITKPPQVEKSFSLHQDWNYTDEKHHMFATCWVPLSDVSSANGGFSYILGSHKYFTTYRSISLPSTRIAFSSMPSEIRKDLNLNKGHCVAFHQALLHGSYPNQTNHSRIVLGFIVKLSTSPITYYSSSGENNISAYDMDSQSFNEMLSEIPTEHIPPNAKHTFTFRHKEPLPDAKDFLTAYRINQHAHQIIADKNCQQEFIKKGYVKLGQVIDQNTINELRQLYEHNFTTQQGMYVTHHSITNANSNKQISDKIFSLLKKHIDNITINTQNLIAHFAVKATGQNGVFNLHQDWSIVEEQLFGVLHCWIPLQDVTKENGTLAVLPKSHLLFNNYRSGTIPIRFIPLNEYSQQLDYLEVKVGDIVFYHPALFHGSGKNQSPSARLAIVAAFAHKHAKKVYYHRAQNGVVMHELADNDLFGRLSDLAKGAEPTGSEIKHVESRVLDMVDEDIKFKLWNFYKDQQHVEV